MSLPCARKWYVHLCGARKGFNVRRIFWTSIGWVVKGESLYSPFPIVYFPMQKKIIIICLRKTFLYYSLHKILFRVYSVFFLVACNVCVFMAYDDITGLVWQQYWQTSKLTITVFLLWRLFFTYQQRNCGHSMTELFRQCNPLWQCIVIVVVLIPVCSHSFPSHSEIHAESTYWW